MADQQPIQNYGISDSSHIVHIQYDPNEKIMVVEFSNNARYEYSGISQTVVDSFVNSQSVGSYFYKLIRGKFNSEKV